MDMSVPTGLPAGLAFLPSWLNPSKDPLAFDAALAVWCRASGWKGAGVVWPLEGPAVGLQVRADGVTEPTPAPPEAGEVLRTIQSGHGTVIWAKPNSCGRLYATIQPAGRPPGVSWADRAGAAAWTEADRQYLILSAALIERSLLLATKAGSLIDADRLHQRLSDAASLAGRMAHDFNTVLTGIIGFADLTLPLLAANSQPSRYVQQLADVGKRGHTFTQELHQLSRAGGASPLPTHLSAVLAKEEMRLRSLFPAGFQLGADLPAGLPTVAMDAGPLAIVLGHLIQNGLEAGGSPPRVAVAARTLDLTATEAKGYLGAVRPGPHVEVRVTDAGPGVKPEHRSKLFTEPFFTTKLRHRGLGLAVVYRTLHAHAGGVKLDPPAEPGISVRFVLPPGAVRPPVAATPITL